MVFKKTAQLETLATFKSLDQGWKKTASRGTSHFAQADQKSIQAILNAVSEKYCISLCPDDYIYVVYRAVTQDEPNGNGDAFPREELLSFNKTEKKPVYQTFEFKPKHVNHQADDPRMARGVVIDTHYNEVDPEDCFVEILVAIDTKKDPILAQGILDGSLTDVSMGCDALRTECNVCDNIAYSEKDYCVHIKPGNRMKMHRSPGGEMKQAFERCYEVTFQEISNVDDPADKKADMQEMLTVDEVPTKTANSASVLDLKARIKQLDTQVDVITLKRVAHMGRDEVEKIAKKNAAPEHHVVATVYAKHHELAFGDPHKAMKSTMEETGKPEHEIRACWSKKMAEDKPHPEAEKICASLNAQLLACGDMKKAIKRTAEDKAVEPSVVEKCATHMKECNRMANYTASEDLESKEGKEGKEEIPEGVVHKDGEAEEDDSEKSAAEAPMIETNLPGPKQMESSPVKQDVADKIALAARQTTIALKNKKKAQETPSEDGGIVEQAQADDAPDKKSLGDMGVKTGAEDGPPAEIKEKIEEKKAQEKDDEESEKKAQEDEKEKEAAKTASSFPFADFYKDVSAKKTASGEVHVKRAGKLIFTIPASKKASAQDALRTVASVGIIGAAKKYAIQKRADAGVQEGAISDGKGAYGPAPQSSQDGAITDEKDTRKINPFSTTAEGEITDGKLKQETKSIENSDVREQSVSDNKGGYETSADTAVGLGEHSNNKEKHNPKNVGSDNVLSQRQTDMVLKGLDPRTAALVKSRLAKIAQEMMEEAKKAEKDEEAKEKEAKIAQEMADIEAKKMEEKEVEKKASLFAQARLDKFKRGLRLAARRFALNLEPCDLKHSLGAILSTRHEASGFEGMEAGLVIDVVERGFNTNAAMERTVDHLIKRAQEMAAMPDDSLKAIEADAENLSPVHPQSASEHEDDEEGVVHKESTLLRRRASLGSMPTLLPAERQDTAVPTKMDLVRQALGGGALNSKYFKR